MTGSLSERAGSFERAIDLLQAILGDGEQSSIGTIAAGAGLPLSSAHRLVALLERRGLLVRHERAKEFAFVPGNWIDGPTAVEWGWANHCVPAGDLISAVASLAERIALTPPEVLRLKKLSINRAAEAGGFRQALSGIAEIDALLHLAPAVLDIRARLAERGLKAVIAEYKVPPTTPLVAPAKE